MTDVVALEAGEFVAVDLDFVLFVHLLVETGPGVTV